MRYALRRLKMGFLAGMTAGLYRQTTDGRRVYQLVSLAPRRRWPTYLVSDSDAARIEARIRRVLLFQYVAFIPLIGVLSVPMTTSRAFDRVALWWLAALVLVPASVMYSMLRFWALRGVPRIVLGALDLEPFNRRAREMSQLQAVGARTLVALILAGVVMTGVQIAVLMTDGVWWAWLGTLLLGGSTVLMTRQLWVLRHAARRGNG